MELREGLDVFMVDLTTGEVFLEGNSERISLPKIVDNDVIELFIGEERELINLTDC